ncbi:MAG: hypothetical protein NT154_33070, partial [Verrucomicrobia bacterium]|nr:hypothetical protein [Verrucomicrobiota bacterium]
APPTERRIHPAARRVAQGLPDESGVPIGTAARLGGGIWKRPKVPPFGSISTGLFPTNHY